MLAHPTLDKLHQLKFLGMATALNEQLDATDIDALSFDERFALLVDRELTYRDNQRMSSRLRRAKLRHNACLEDIDYRHPRALDKSLMLSFASCRWLKERLNMLITGPTGIGKSFLSCAFVEAACRKGFNATYVRMPRLLHDLAVSRGDGTYTRHLTRLAKLDLLAIDDWLLAPLKDGERRDLLEVIEDRSERTSTIIASQLPVKDWHGVIGDPNQADALCDRLMHQAHRIELKGPSLRQTKAAPKGKS